MSEPERKSIDRTRLFAIAYCTVAYPISALLLLSRSRRWNREDSLYEFIIWACVALLLIGGFADGTSTSLRKIIVFRAAIVALLLSFFASSITPAVW